MLIGYARVSTPEQNLLLQTDALENAGCEKLFQDIASGATTMRPGLEEALAFARPGDTLVVWKLDRFGRSLRHLTDSVENLKKQGIGFRTLHEAIDTSTSGGKLFFHLLASIAEFERDLLTERTQAGLAAARLRGRKGGRRRRLNEQQMKILQDLYKDPENPVPLICGTLGISRSTLYRYVERRSTD